VVASSAHVFAESESMASRKTPSMSLLGFDVFKLSGPDMFLVSDFERWLSHPELLPRKHDITSMRISSLAWIQG